MAKQKAKFRKKCGGVLFEIRETGRTWTIFVKEKKKKSFDRVQSVADLKIAKQIVNNQRECKRR